MVSLIFSDCKRRSLMAGKQLKQALVSRSIHISPAHSSVFSLDFRYNGFSHSLHLSSLFISWLCTAFLAFWGFFGYRLLLYDIYSGNSCLILAYDIMGIHIWYSLGYCFYMIWWESVFAINFLETICIYMIATFNWNVG